MYFIEFRSSRKQELISDYLITVVGSLRGKYVQKYSEEPVNQRALFLNMFGLLMLFC